MAESLPTYNQATWHFSTHPVGCGNGMSRNCHGCNMCLTSLAAVFLFVLIYRENYIFGGIIFGIFYIIYLAESFISSTVRRLCNIITPEQAQARLTAMKECNVRITWHAKCSHESRTYVGLYGSSSETIVTHRAKKHLEWPQTDKSEPFPNWYLHNCDMVKLRVDISPSFKPEAKELYNNMWRQFCAENSRDVDNKHWETQHFTNSELKQTVLVTPWWVNIGVYSFFTLILLSYPYRVLLEARSSYIHYSIYKEQDLRPATVPATAPASENPEPPLENGLAWLEAHPLAPEPEPAAPTPAPVAPHVITYNATVPNSNIK